MRLVFQHTYSKALTIVSDAKQIMFGYDYYTVECSNSVGYFPRSSYFFLGIDSGNLL